MLGADNSSVSTASVPSAKSPRIASTAKKVVSAPKRQSTLDNMVIATMQVGAAKEVQKAKKAAAAAAKKKEMEVE